MNRLFANVKLDGSEVKYLLFSGYSGLEDEFIRLFTTNKEIIDKIKHGKLTEFKTKKKYGEAKLKIIYRQKTKLRDGNEKVFNVYAYEFGNPKAKKLNIRDAGLHGGESAAVLSQLYFLKKTLDPETELGKVVFWKESYNAGILCVDPFGYDSLSRLFFHAYEGVIERWPSDRDQLWMDINLNWERTLIEETKAAKRYYSNLMKKFERKLFLDHHETSPSTPDIRIPYDIREFSVLEGMDTLSLLCSDEKIESDNLGKASVDYLYLYGKQPYLYLGYFDFLERNSIIRQIEFDKNIVPTDGVARMHDDHVKLGAYPLTNFAKSKGADAIVYETYPKDLSKRVEEHLIVSEGAILEFMGYNPFKFNFQLTFPSKEFGKMKYKIIEQPRIGDLVRCNEFYPFTKKDVYLNSIRSSIPFMVLCGLLFGLPGLVASFVFPTILIALTKRGYKEMFKRFVCELEGLMREGKIHFIPESINDEIKKGKDKIEKILENGIEASKKNLIIAETEGKAWVLTPHGIFKGTSRQKAKNI